MDGQDQPVQFTRRDAERLVAIETKLEWMSVHVKRIVNFGYVVGVSIIVTVIGVFVKIVIR